MKMTGNKIYNNYKKNKYLKKTGERVKLENYPSNLSTRYINIINKNNLKLPSLYEFRSDCTGCSACYAVCSNDAIKMLPDEEGFNYPVIDASKCTNCKSCEKVCSNKEMEEIL